jgi:MFS family permease
MTSLLHQPRSVYAVAFACVVAFMGIGLVDPILPVLASDLDATPSEVSLLFTSYFAMTGLSMLVTGWVASRIGPRRTLLAGLVLVVAFAGRLPRVGGRGPVRRWCVPRLAGAVGGGAGAVAAALGAPRRGRCGRRVGSRASRLIRISAT